MSTPTPPTPDAPKRRSVRDKMKDAPHIVDSGEMAVLPDKAGTPGTRAVQPDAVVPGGSTGPVVPEGVPAPPNPWAAPTDDDRTHSSTDALTATTIGGFTAVAPDSTSTFQIDSTGTIAEAVAAPISPAFSREQEHLPLDLTLAASHHLFLTGADVEPDELEALAVSIWEDAGWISAGVLRLSNDARLEGPWEVSPEERRELGTTADLTRAWVLYCPPERGRPPLPGKGMEDRWTKAFPGGVVRGFEYRTLLNLERMARRLAGALRIAGSGAVIAPDPDSAVTLVVCSPRWLDPEHLLDALRPDFPTIVDSRDVPTEDPTPRSSRDVQRIAALHKDLGDIPEEVRANIEAARREAIGAQPVVDTYALVAPAGNKSTMKIEVQRMARVPQALRWEEWSRGVVIGYTILWTMPGTVGTPTNLTSRAMRLERLRVAEDIENAAAVIAGLVGGQVIDEDGFLVALGD